jgi:TRAP-type transport system small permease protein
MHVPSDGDQPGVRPKGLTPSGMADAILHAAAVLLMLTMLAVVVLGVAFRAANTPLVWSDELAQYLLVWLGFTGWIIASRRRNHIRITVFIDKLPDLVRRAVEIVIQLAIIGFAVVLIWQSYGLIQRNSDVYAVTLPFPSALLYALLPVLAIALVGQAAIEIRDVLRGRDRAGLDHGGQIL